MSDAHVLEVVAEALNQDVAVAGLHAGAVDADDESRDGLLDADASLAAPPAQHAPRVALDLRARSALPLPPVPPMAPLT